MKKKISKIKKIKTKRTLIKNLGAHFVPANCSWAWTLECGWYVQSYSLEKTIFLVSAGIRANSSLVRSGSWCALPLLSAGVLPGTNP